METQNLEKPDDNNLVVNYFTVRKAVGVIGITLPIILLIGDFVFIKCNRVENSISDYYYTIMGHYLVGALCAIALFLYSYKGYDKIDNWLSNLSCIFALAVAFCPTTCADHDPFCNILTIDSSPFISAMHNIFAVLFLLSLAYYSYFIFTKGSDNPTPQKINRNKIFRICGIVILVAVVLMALIVNIQYLAQILSPYKVIFILETIAVWAFGLSWIVKGQLIFKDLAETNS
jgi:hypothetical protein